MPGVANCDGRDVLIGADGDIVLRREGDNDIEVRHADQELWIR